MLLELFRLPYRQTEDPSRSLTPLITVDIDIPNFTSLAKRAAKLRVPQQASNRKGPIDELVDKHRLKVFGERKGRWAGTANLNVAPGESRTWQSTPRIVRSWPKYGR